MMKLKTPFLLLFSCFILLCLTSCNSQERNTKNLTALIELPLTLKSPDQENDFMSYKVFPLLYRRLFRYKPASDFSFLLESELVKDYQQKQWKKFEFEIKPGNFFLPEQEITAKDVEWVLEQYKQSKLYGQMPLGRIKKISTHGRYGLEVEFEKPEPYFLDALTFVMIFKKSGDQVLGSGDYVLDRNKGTDVVLRHKQDSSKTISLRYLKDETLRFHQLVTGKADLALSSVGISKSDFLLKNLPENLNTISGSGSAIQYLGFNFRKPEIKNPEFRKCVADAIVFSEIQSARTGEVAEKANTLLSPVFRLKTPPVLLSNSSVRTKCTSSNRVFKFLSSADSHSIDFAKLIVIQLKHAGISAEVVPMEMGFYIKNLKAGNFDFYLGRYNFMSSPLGYGFLFGPTGYLSKAGVEPQKYHDVFEQIIHESNVKKSEKRISEFENLVINQERLLVPLLFWKNIWFGNKRFKNVSLYPTLEFLGEFLKELK